MFKNIEDVMDLCQLSIVDEWKYFKNLQNQSLSHFYDSQKKFVKAVQTWSDLLGEIIVKFRNNKIRYIISKNLVDETEDIGHVGTFEKMLSQIENHKDYIKCDNISENDAITKFCFDLLEITNKQPEYIFSYMATTEYIYIQVSKNINKYLSQYFKQNEIYYYALHEVIDETHSRELYELLFIEEIYTKNRDEYILNGVNDAIDSMKKLYDAMSLRFS